MDNNKDTAIVDKSLQGNNEDLSVAHLLRVAEVEAGLDMADGIRKQIFTDITAQIIYGLREIEKNKLWRQKDKFGRPKYQSFVDYVDQNSDKYGFKSSKYYEMDFLLRNEGETRFNLFNKQAIPKTTRKKLIEGKVPVYIDGHDVLIGTDRVSVKDEKSLKELVIAVADSLDALNLKIEKQKKQIADRDAIVISQMAGSEIQKAVEIIGLDPTPLGSSIVNLSSAFRDVINQVKRFPDSATSEIFEKTWTMITTHTKELQSAFGEVKGTRASIDTAPSQALSDGDYIEDLIDRVMDSSEEDELMYRLNRKDANGREISEGDNDAELAAKL